MRTSPFTFVPKTRASSSSLDSSNGARPSARPALLKRMSRPPSCSTAAATNRALLSGSVTSSSSAISVSSRSTRRAPPATRTPAAARARAVAWPMPGRRAGDDRRLAAEVEIRHAPDASCWRSGARAVRAPRPASAGRDGRPGASCGGGRSAPRAGAGACASRRGSRRPARRGRAPRARGKPLVTVQTCRSCTSATSGSVDECACDVVRVDPGRRGLEEDAARLADQRPARAHHQRSHEQAGDRVEAVPPREEDEAARERRAGERREVGRDVQERSLHVEARAVGAREHERRGEVDRDADERDDEHDAAVHDRRVCEAPRGGVDDPDSQEQERDPVRLCREDLGPAEAERPRPARRTRREARRNERRGERGRVGEHVPGVREQRERAGDDARGDLDGHEGDDQRERDRERAPVLHPAVIVRVPRTVGVEVHAAA